MTVDGSTPLCDAQHAAAALEEEEEKEEEEVVCVCVCVCVCVLGSSVAECLENFPFRCLSSLFFIMTFLTHRRKKR